MKSSFLLSIIISLSLLLSCSDDNCDKEVFNPRQNNPVNTIGWLKSIKDSSKETNSYISLYEWDGKDYYYVYKALPENLADAPTVTIYEADGTRYADCGGYENIDSPNAIRCRNFHDQAALSAELWNYTPCKK